MSRPRTIPGLLWRWLIGTARRRRAAVLAGAALASLAAAPVTCGDRCRVGQAWNAGLAEYDYLQSLDLSRADRGRYTYGHSQNVRYDIEFRHRVLSAGVLELSDFVEIGPDGARHPRDWPARRIGFEVSEGEYCFEPPYDRRRCFACRLDLRESLPGSYRDFYGCPE